MFEVSSSVRADYNNNNHSQITSYFDRSSLTCKKLNAVANCFLC